MSRNPARLLSRSRGGSGSFDQLAWTWIVGTEALGDLQLGDACVDVPKREKLGADVHAVLKGIRFQFCGAQTVPDRILRSP